MSEKIKHNIDSNYPKVFEDWRVQSNLTLNSTDVQFNFDLSTDMRSHSIKFLESVFLNWGKLSVNVSLPESNIKLSKFYVLCT